METVVVLARAEDRFSAVYCVQVCTYSGMSTKQRKYIESLCMEYRIEWIGCGESLGRSNARYVLTVALMYAGCASVIQENEK